MCQSIRLRIRRQVPSLSPGHIILKLQHITNMRSVLHIEQSPKSALFNKRKVRVQNGVNNPEPNRTKKNPKRGSGEDLSNSVVPEIDTGVHSEEREGPREEVEERVVAHVPEGETFEGEKGEIGSEEEHVLAVAGGPAVGVAHLEEGAGGGPGLLDGGLDDFVDELRQDEAEREEHALELAAEEEVGDEAAERDEDGDEGNPRQKVPYAVALLIAHVRQGHGLQRRRHGRSEAEE